MKVYNKHHKNSPAGTVYVGRPTGWGNPFVVGRDGQRGECVRKFRAWLQIGESYDCEAATGERRQWILDNLHRLKGKNLECWCAPKECHAKALMELANETTLLSGV